MMETKAVPGRLALANEQPDPPINLPVLAREMVEVTILLANEVDALTAMCVRELGVLLPVDERPATTEPPIRNAVHQIDMCLRRLMRLRCQMLDVRQSLAMVLESPELTNGQRHG